MDIATRTLTENRENESLDLRGDEDQCRILEEAAAASRLTLTAFVLSYATDAARNMLADRSSFARPPSDGPISSRFWKAMVGHGHPAQPPNRRLRLRCRFRRRRVRTGALKAGLLSVRQGLDPAMAAVHTDTVARLEAHRGVVAAHNPGMPSSRAKMAA